MSRNIRRVLLVSSYFPPTAGGVAAHVSMIADRLQRHGIEVAVATGPVAGKRPPVSYSLFSLPHLALANIASVYRDGSQQVRQRFQDGLRRELEQISFSPDVIHAHDAHIRGFEIPGALFRAMPMTPIVNTVHGGESLDDVRPGIQHPALLPWDAQITVSEALSERLPGHVPKIVIPPGFNGDIFNAAYRVSDGKSFLRGRRGHAIVHPAQPSHVKGHDITYEAFKIVRRTLADAYLVTADATGYVHPHRRAFMADFKRSIERDGLEAAVQFAVLNHGNLPGMYRSLRDQRGVVWHPSRVEGLPMALLEAQACGAVPIATDIDGQRNAIGEGAGILVPPEDPEALARATIALFEHADRMPNMSSHGVAFAKQFDIARQIPHLLDVYENVVIGCRRLPTLLGTSTSTEVTHSLQ